MGRIRLTETVLRDGQQCLADATMSTADMLPALAPLDQVGYYALECWGGSTFNTCVRYLREDPWKRLRILRDSIKKTKIQMLCRGQNLLGYRHYADDTVEYFIKRSVAGGVDIVRAFDPLNDPRNLETIMHSAKYEGAHMQAAICYTQSPIHNLKYFADYASQLESMGADSICIKDMSGVLRPFEAEKLVKAIRAAVKIPLSLHIHDSCSLAFMTATKAIEAGIDMLDTSISPFSSGLSLPATEGIVAALHNTEYDTGLDLDKLYPIAQHFQKLRASYLESGMMKDQALQSDTHALRQQIPASMLADLTAQLGVNDKTELLPNLLSEVLRVRKDVGFPPLMTPVAQIIGAQALFNVTGKEPYAIVTNEFRNLVRGAYGRLPSDMRTEFVEQILAGQEPINHRPADRISAEIERLRNRVAPYAEQEEDILTLAMLEDVAIAYFEWRKSMRYNLDENGQSSAKVHPV